MSIFSDFHYTFLKTLVSCGVKFMIVGGQAAIYYGVRRSTGDLDILVEPSEENGKNILEAFSKLNLKSDNISASEFKGQIFLGIGLEPDAVDIFTLTPGVDFRTAIDRTLKLQDRDLYVNMINIEDLISNKENLQREGEKKLLDQYDAEVLKKILRTKKD